MSSAETVDDPWAVDAGDADVDEDDGSTGSSDNLWGLRNTEPRVRPGDIGEQLDFGAKWYEHLQVGFIKQSSSGGAEAWMHYVMAIILLAVGAFRGDLELPGADQDGAADDVQDELGEAGVTVDGEDWME